MKKMGIDSNPVSFRYHPLPPNNPDRHVLSMFIVKTDGLLKGYKKMDKDTIYFQPSFVRDDFVFIRE